MKYELAVTEDELLEFAKANLQAKGKIPSGVFVRQGRTTKPDDSGRYTFIFYWEDEDTTP